MSINTTPLTHIAVDTINSGISPQVDLGKHDLNAGFRAVVLSGTPTFDIECRMSIHGDFSPIDANTTGLTATTAKFTNDGNASAMRINITSGSGTVFLDITTGR